MSGFEELGTHSQSLGKATYGSFCKGGELRRILKFPYPQTKYLSKRKKKIIVHYYSKV